MQPLRTIKQKTAKKNKMQKLTVKLTLIILLTLGASAKAQQLPLLSQYMFNGFLVNPAVAGVDGYTSITLTSRQQWLGLPDAPKTNIVAFQTRLLKNNFVSRNSSVWRKFVHKSRSGRVGLGGYLYNDKTGLIDRTGAQITYAYHLKMRTGQLSFGLSANIYQLSINRAKLNYGTSDNNDALTNNSDLKMYIPDFNFGVYYSTEKYYAGFSTTQLAQSTLQLANDNSSQFKSYRQYSLTGGYNIEVNKQITVVPSILVKVTNQLVSQIDLSSKIYFNESYYAGLSYRTGSAIIVMGGVTVDKFTFGYAFDYNLNAISNHSFGSHEVMASVKFGDSARRYRWINRY
jgi:type IX secretion system PorP/SprF family membrane protein